MQIMERIIRSDGGEERALRMIRAEIEDLSDNLEIDNIETASWHASRLAEYLDTLAAHRNGDDMRKRASSRMRSIIDNLL